jgi:hypothetical protein
MSSGGQAGHSLSPTAVLGCLTVSVLKASGKLFESGLRVSIRLSIGSVTAQSSARRHPLLDRRKPIQWEDESFAFPITQQADTLMVCCHADDAKQDMIGSASIALAHLPQGTDVIKWPVDNRHRTASTRCIAAPSH